MKTKYKILIAKILSKLLTIFISKNMSMTKKIIGPFDEKELVGSLEEIHIQ